MKNTIIVEAFRLGEWGKLWANRDVLTQSTVGTLILSYVYICWWQEEDLGKEIYSGTKTTVDITSGQSIEIFLDALVSMALGKEERMKGAVQRLKQDKYAKWMLDWLAIEYLARSRQYLELKNFIARNLKESREFLRNILTPLLMATQSKGFDWSLLELTQQTNVKGVHLPKALAIRLGIKDDVATTADDGSHFSGDVTFKYESALANSDLALK